MDWDTLPGWFWIIHHAILLITLGMAIFSIVRKRLRKESILLIFLLLTSSVVFFMNTIGRLQGTNEFEWLYKELLSGSIWAIYVLINYFYLLVWWILFLVLKEKNPITKGI